MKSANNRVGRPVALRSRDFQNAKLRRVLSLAEVAEAQGNTDQGRALRRAAQEMMTQALAYSREDILGNCGAITRADTAAVVLPIPIRRAGLDAQ